MIGLYCAAAYDRRSPTKPKGRSTSTEAYYQMLLETI